MAKKDNLYIDVLKFGKLKIQEGTKFKELKDHLKGIGYEYKTEENEKHWQRLFYDTFSGLEGTTSARLDSESGEETLSFMEMDAYFRLLEHEELKNARNSSLLATIFAIIAIGLSIFATMESVYYSKQQLESSISIDQLKTLQIDQDELNSKLDKLILNTSIMNKKAEKEKIIKASPNPDVSNEK